MVFFFSHIHSLSGVDFSNESQQPKSVHHLARSPMAELSSLSPYQQFQCPSRPCSQAHWLLLFSYLHFPSTLAWLSTPTHVSLLGSGYLGLTLWTGQSKTSQVSKERSDGVTGIWVHPEGTKMLKLSQERYRFEFLFHYLLPMSSLKSYLTLLGFNLSLKRN